MKSTKIKIFFFLILLLLSYFYISNDIGKENSNLSIIKDNIPESLKVNIKQIIFVFKYQEELKKQNKKLIKNIETLQNNNLILEKKVDSFLESLQIIEDYEYEISDLKNHLNNKIVYKSIQRHIIDNIKKISFNKISEEKFSLNNKINKLILKKYHINNIITFSKTAGKASAYLEFLDDNIFITTATGIVSVIDINELDNTDFFSGKIINSNLFEIIDYDKFYSKSEFGIKDVLIDNNKIYISLTYDLYPNCYNTGILYAELNYNFLKFEKFFIPEDCIGTENDYGEFNAHHASGRMSKYKDNKILFAIGEYRYRDHAQNESNVFGKLIAIDKDTKLYNLISMGHRNNQGLYYDSKNDTIFMTEHGPNGGDEININLNPNNIIKNYGWPISSYGEHYGFNERDDNADKYIKAPLYKSHSDYGFIEPLDYFVPSIGISQIINVPQKFISGENYQIFVSSLGLDSGKAIYLYELDSQFNIISKIELKIGERIRDMIYIPQRNQILLFLENTGSLAILNNI